LLTKQNNSNGKEAFKNAGLDKHFEDSYGHDIFADVGKDGIGLGGAYSKGLPETNQMTLATLTVTSKVAIGDFLNNGHYKCILFCIERSQ
jgi:hypothetical protein